MATEFIEISEQEYQGGASDFIEITEEEFNTPQEPVGTSIGQEISQLPAALKQSFGQPLEAIGETAQVAGFPAVGAALKGAIQEPEGYVSAGQRFMEPQEGEFQVAGFAPQYAPRAIAEQTGQILGSIGTRIAGAVAGGGLGALISPATGVAGAAAGQFAGPALFEAAQIVGPVALERAKNNGYTEPTDEDMAYAVATAAGSGLLNAFGAKYLPGGEKAVGSFSKRLAASFIGEGIPEGLQSLTQQVGETVETKKGIQVSPKQAIGEALIGGGAGAAATIVSAPFTPEQIEEQKITERANKEAENLVIGNDNPQGKAVLANKQKLEQEIADAKQVLSAIESTDPVAQKLKLELKEKEAILAAAQRQVDSIVDSNEPVVEAEKQQIELAKAITTPAEEKPATPKPLPSDVLPTETPGATYGREEQIYDVFGGITRKPVSIPKPAELPAAPTIEEQTAEKTYGGETGVFDVFAGARRKPVITEEPPVSMVGKEVIPGVTPAPVAETPAVAPATEVAPASIKSSSEKSAGVLNEFIQKELQRQVDEQRGQQVLDNMEEAGESPRAVVEEFYRNIYDNLPQNVRARFDKYVKRMGWPIPANMDSSPKSIGMEGAIDLGNDVQGLEGIERGFVALVKTANELYAQAQARPTTTPTLELVTPAVSETITPAEPAGISVGNRIKLGKSPQTYIVEEVVPQTEADKANNEQFYSVKNERTGETQVVEKADMKQVGGKRARKMAVEVIPKQESVTPIPEANRYTFEEAVKAVDAHFGKQGIPEGFVIVNNTTEPDLEMKAGYFVNRGQIVINLAYIAKGENLGDIIDHELGHYIFGDPEFQADFKEFWELMTPEEKAKADQIINQFYNKDTGAVKMEEKQVRAFMQLIQDSKAMPKWKQILDKIKRWINEKLGTNLQVTDRGALAVLAAAHKRFKSGEQIVREIDSGVLKTEETAQDAEYLAAVERGDMETAQRMVDEAAKKAGYVLSGFHGSQEKNIKQFKNPTWVAKNKNLAERYSEDYQGEDVVEFIQGKVYPVIVNPGKTLKLWRFKDWVDLVEKLAPNNDVLKNEILRNQTNLAFDYTNTMPIFEFNDPNRIEKKANWAKENRNWDNFKKTTLRNRQEAKRKGEEYFTWNTEGYDLSSTWREDFDQSQANFSNQIKLVNALFDLGYDTLGQLESGRNASTDAAYLVKNPTQIKSADPVTYDDAGNVIPLSQRFRATSPDIRRMAVEPTIEPEAKTITEGLVQGIDIGKETNMPINNKIESHIKNFAFVRGIFESASDRLRRAKFTKLATAIDDYYDQAQRRLGFANKILLPAFDEYSKQSKSTKKRIDEEVKMFFAAQENKRDTDEFFDELNPITQKIVTAWQKFGEESGKENQRIGIKVFDRGLQRWRPIGKVEKFWPRVLKPEYKRALMEPDKYQKEYNEIVEALMKSGRINTPEEAEVFISDYQGTSSQNDYFSGIEAARGQAFPEELYDYSMQVMTDYVARWAQHSSRIEQFGQKLGENSKTLWDRSRESTRDRRTIDYITAAQERVEGYYPNDPIVKGMATLNIWSSGLQLGNPASSMLNFFGGTTLNAMVGQPGAFSSYLSSFVELRKLGRELKDAREKGIVSRDLMNIVGDHQVVLDSSGLAKAGQKTTDFLLKWSGFTPIEQMVRTQSMIIGKSFLRKTLSSLSKNPNSSFSKRALTWLNRNNIDADKLIVEQGTGPETDRLLRYFANISQGSYTIAQTPIFTDTPIGRFLFKYQKFSTQVMRQSWKNTFEPAWRAVTNKNETLQLPDPTRQLLYRLRLAEAKELGDNRKITLDEIPKKVTKAEGKALTIIPVMMWLGSAYVGGEVILRLRDMLFGVLMKGPDYEDIIRAFEDDEDDDELYLSLERAWYNLIGMGALGLIGNYAQFFMDWQDRERVKNPLDPPALSIFKETATFIQNAVDQGKITVGDVNNYLNRTFSAYRVSQRLYQTAASGLGYSDAPTVAEEMFRREVASINKYARRWAESAGLEYRTKRPMDIAPSKMTSINREIANYLQRGEPGAAVAYAKEYLNSLPKKERANAIQSMESGARNRQPLRLGSGPMDQAEKIAFKKWLKEKVSKEKFDEIQKLDSQYQKNYNIFLNNLPNK